MEIWGSGTPRREFLYVDDLAEACLHFMGNYERELCVNIGWGEDLAISELAAAIARVVGYDGELSFDRSKPDGTPRKLLDTSRATASGWNPKVPLMDGLQMSYRWYLENQGLGRK